MKGLAPLFGSIDPFVLLPTFLAGDCSHLSEEKSFPLEMVFFQLGSWYLSVRLQYRAHTRRDLTGFLHRVRHECKDGRHLASSGACAELTLL